MAESRQMQQGTDGHCRQGSSGCGDCEEDLEFGKDYNYMQQWSTCEAHWGQYLGLFSPQASQQSANTAAKQFPMCLHHA